MNPGRVGLKATLLVIALLGLPAAASGAPAPVATIDIEGVISPVTLRLVGLAIDRAQAERAQALVIQLDTPGGLERSMRAIVQRMMNAEVPVVVFVAPTGARAASAGVFITMAAHVAAMAPATNIGAASPVALGGGADKTMMKKIENDAAAFIRTIAVERGRNADWAEKAVREAVAITEREALKLKSTGPSAHYYLGMTLIKLRRYEEAQSELESAVKNGGDGIALAHKFLGGLYMSARRNKEAADELEKYVQLDPKAADAERIKVTIKDLRNKQ